MRRQGIAIVATLAVLVIVALLVFGTFFTTQIETWMTRNDTTSTQAYYVAQAGVQKYKTVAFQTFRYYLNNMNAYSTAGTIFTPCGNLLNNGLDLNRNKTISAADGDLMPGYSVTENVVAGQPNKGSYTLTFNTDGPYVILKSVGSFGGARSTVQAVAVVDNVGLFSNAVASASGASGHLNGNVEFWGSAYIEGTDPTLAVIDGNGGFNQHNFYNSDVIKDKTGVTETQLADIKLYTKEQKDLCATLRVHIGKVKLSGNVTLGDATAPAGSKNTLSGVWVQSGSQGSCSASPVPDICQQGSAVMYTDAVGAYNLSGPINIPTLDGANTCSTGGTWRSCLQNLAAASGVTLSNFTVTGSGASTTVNFTASPAGLGSCSIPGSTVTVSGGEITINFGPISFECVDNSAAPTKGFRYTKESGTKGKFEVYGSVVDLRGVHLKFAEDIDIRYTTKASLLVETADGKGGDITIDGDVRAATAFPTENILGLIADRDLIFTGALQNLTGGPQEQIAMGQFFGGRQTKVLGGGVVFGTIVTKELCTNTTCNPSGGGGTAKIFQVPGLEYNLAPGFDKVSGNSQAAFGQITYERR